MSPRECMGFSDFQFVPNPRRNRDGRRFPGHREVLCYLKDFTHAFRLADAIRLNTKVLRVVPINSGGKWLVKSVRVVEPDREEQEEVFDAVVVASGHYSQPSLPSIKGMEQWRRRQLHSHSYRVPDPFRGDVVVVVGCGESGLDIALELCSGGVAREMLANHPELQLHPQVDPGVVFADGRHVVADTVIYCTGYTYSFPFLNTGGGLQLTVEDNRVGPLYEHTFPPALAPSLSFVGVPMRIFAPWFFEAQARWVAQVLAGKKTLPPEQDMMRAVQEDYRARELAGVPTKHAHVVGAVQRMEILEFVYRNSDMPRMDDWKMELFVSVVRNTMDDRETFRDRDDDVSDTIKEGRRTWLCVSAAQYEAALAAAATEPAGADDATTHMHAQDVAGSTSNRQP
ncbi:hypothetical protein EJB05_14830, partial [Eragrostis curvula]